MLQNMPVPTCEAGAQKELRHSRNDCRKIPRKVTNTKLTPCKAADCATRCRARIPGRTSSASDLLNQALSVSGH